MTMQFTQHPDVFAKLPALAQRLGVPSLAQGKHSDLIVLRTRDGQKYDLFALLNALLDRLEQSAAKDDLFASLNALLDRLERKRDD